MTELIHAEENFKHALTVLYENMNQKKEISLEPDLSSLDNFIQNTFSLSFPEFDFDTWHIHLIAQDIEEAIAEDKWYVLVLPRFHLKSTISYATVLYKMLKARLSDDFVYISYKAELATYHISNIKRIVVTNPVLSKCLVDRQKQSNTSFLYENGQKQFRSISSGIFGVKRGIHTGRYGMTICLTPGTRILTNSGYTHIEDIQTGDMVRTHKNRYREVTNIFNRYIKEQITILYLDNNEIIGITKTHPVLTSEGWIPAGELRLEDDIMHSRMKKIVHTWYEGYVYNLEVEDDNSYVGKGIIYHNCDDILADPQNPLTFPELDKIEKFYNAEISNIPIPGSFLMVVGTIQDYSDLLFKLRENPRYKYRYMPALNPILEQADKKVLWEKGFSLEKLMEHKKTIGAKAFASEFELAPVLSTEAFFSREELDKNIDRNLYNINMPGW